MAALLTLTTALVHGVQMRAAPGGALSRGLAEHSMRPAVSALRMDAEADFGLSEGQKYGPTAPAHPADLPWTNLEKQEGVQVVKAASAQLRAPLEADMQNDEIFVSKDSIHILKHHGSYMQTNRDIKKKKERDLTYQFMLRLKMPCGEVPGPLFRELDDLSNKYGQGDLRATTRQAFQLHGVMKSDLKTVISTIANVGQCRDPALALAARPRRSLAPARAPSHCLAPSSLLALIGLFPSPPSSVTNPRTVLSCVRSVTLPRPHRFAHIRRLRRHQP